MRQQHIGGTDDVEHPPRRNIAFRHFVRIGGGLAVHALQGLHLRRKGTDQAVQHAVQARRRGDGHARRDETVVDLETAIVRAP